MSDPRSPAPTNDSRRIAPHRVTFAPQWSQPGTPFRHTWESVANIDQFRWLVRRDVQDHLAVARRELGIQHVRAVGMFDDEMRVYRPSPASFMGTEPRTPRSNWQTVDYVMDSLLERGLSPMVTTSFVPSAMTSGPTTVFTTKGHTSPPDDWNQWSSLVEDATRHALDRYGPAVVRSWYFEVWNEPNLHGWFWGGDQAQFLKLWEVTYRAIKSVDASLRVGGPSCAKAGWIDELLAHGEEYDCRPDYLTAHIYNNDSVIGEALAPFSDQAAAPANQSPDYAMEVIRGVRAQVKRHGFRGELHWNEWGRSFHGVDHRRETAAEAAFIVRLLSEVSQEAEAFAYWCLSDIYDQVGYGREAFHGGYGLMNLQGLRKPAYHAFHLLSRLGTERKIISGIPPGGMVGAIATVDAKGRARILVYAYQHDDAPVRQSLTVTVVLPPRSRPGAVYRIDHHDNNVLTQWRELGAPDYLSRGQRAELAANNELQPASPGAQWTNDAGRNLAHFTMESPGVALLEIEPA